VGSVSRILRLGAKELWSLWRDPVMLVLVLWTFSAAVYVAATAQPDTLSRASLAIVDEDWSPLSLRLRTAFAPPQFAPPPLLPVTSIDPALDAGRYTFVLVIPAGFQRRVLTGRPAALQLNVDATRVGQAFTGSSYIVQIAQEEVTEFLHGFRAQTFQPVELVLRTRFNPVLSHRWFGGVMELANNVTMLAVVLAGAALIREREHGTIEHLLVMPVAPVEILLAKVAASSLVVLAATLFSLAFVVRGALGTPLAGSPALFLAGTALHLFATTSLGVLMATVARTMPQFGLLVVLVLLPLQMLSGANTPRDSIPAGVREAMLLAPTTHYVELAQAVLFRGAGIDVVWRPLLATAAIGTVLFGAALVRFRHTMSDGGGSM
jgi:ABC-2 type transport system permease protein